MSKAKFSSGIVQILVVALVLVMFILGWVYRFGYQNSQKYIQSPTTLPEVLPPSKIPVPVSWKTYTNKELKFSFRYPAVAKLKEETGGNPDYFGVTFNSGKPSSGGYSFTVGKVSSANNQTFESYVLEIYNDDIKLTKKDGKCGFSNTYTELSSTTISGKIARVFDQIDCLGWDTKIFYILRDNDIFYISYGVSGTELDKENYKKITDQILSTFKFLE